MTKIHSGPFIRHDLFRAFYIAMLEQWPEELVERFWLGHPLLLETQKISQAALLKKLWQRNYHIPLDYHCEVLNDIEKFCVQNQLSFSRLIEAVASRVNRAGFIPGWLVLKHLKPMAKGFFIENNAHSIVLKCFNTLAEEYIEDCLHRFAYWEKFGKKSKATLIFSHSKKELTRWKTDYFMIGGSFVRKAPLYLNLPPLPEQEFLGDSRNWNEILWEPQITEFSYQNKTLFQNGEKIGTTLKFSDFCTQKHLDLSGYTLPDQEVIVLKKTIICPIRKRPVLFKGCAYNTPVYLINLYFEESKPRRLNIMENIMLDIIHEKRERHHSPLGPRHAEILKRCENKLVFSYKVSSGVLLLNNEPFAKGILANIAKKIIEMHVHHSRHHFEFKEFKMDSELFLDNKKSNFESRLNAIIEKLNKSASRLSIVKMGNGQFTIESDRNIEFYSEN